MNIDENTNKVDITGSASLVHRLLLSVVSAPYRVICELPKKVMLLQKKQICRIVLVAAIIGAVYFVLLVLLKSYFVDYSLFSGLFPGILMLMCIAILVAMYIFLRHSTILDSCFGDHEVHRMYQRHKESSGDEPEYFYEPDTAGVQEGQEGQEEYDVVSLEEEDSVETQEDVLTDIRNCDLDAAVSSLREVSGSSEKSGKTPTSIELDIESLDLEQLSNPATVTQPVSPAPSTAETSNQSEDGAEKAMLLEQSNTPIDSRFVSESDSAEVLAAEQSVNADTLSGVELASKDIDDSLYNYVLPSNVIESILDTGSTRISQCIDDSINDANAAEEFMSNFCS